MNPRPFLLVALAVGAGCVSAADSTPPPVTPAAPAAATPAPRRSRSDSNAKAPARNDSAAAPTNSFEAFRLISERNIFNSTRTGRRDRSSEESAPRLDVITLVGTMESDRGLRAFFEGSASAFRKALRVGESIESFKVTQVSPTGAELEREGKQFSLRVGQQLRRAEGGEWNLIAADVVRSEAAAAAAKANAGRFDPTAPVAIPANADEVTRRLMEKRNQDLKK